MTGHTQIPGALTVGLAARQLKVSERTIQRLVDAGRLSGCRTASGIRLIDARDVERFRRERQHAG